MGQRPAQADIIVNYLMRIFYVFFIKDEIHVLKGLWLLLFHLKNGLVYSLKLLLEIIKRGQHPPS